MHAWKLALAALAVMLAAPLTANAVNLTLSWTGPTKYTDGTSIAAGTAITYNVYGALKGESKKALALGVTTVTYTRQNVGVGTHCFAVTAVVSGSESELSAEACHQIYPPPPNAPSGLKLTVSVGSTTAYTLIRQTDRLVFLPVGTVPAGTPCIETETANGYFIVPRVSVKFSGDVQPPAVFARCS